MNTFAMFRWMLPLMDAVTEGGGGGSVDLEEVITGSLEGLEDRGDEEAPVVEAMEKPPTPEENEEKELAALEAEIRQKNPQMKGNIAIHRHQAVLTRARNAHEKALKEWAEKQSAWDQKIKEYEEQVAGWKDYEWAKDPDIQAALMAIQLSETNQRQFAELLLQDPRFAEILALKEEAQRGNVSSDRPGPNARSEDGKYQYYDDKGLEALLNWHGSRVRAESEKALEAKFKQELDRRFGDVKPVIDEYQMRNLWNEAKTTQGKVLNNARESWKGFKEKEPLIKKAMIDNPKWDLADAYREVVVNGLFGDQTKREEELKQQWIKDMEAKKAAGGGLKPGSKGVEKVVGDRDGTRDMGDIIRESIAKLR